MYGGLVTGNQIEQITIPAGTVVTDVIMPGQQTHFEMSDSIGVLMEVRLGATVTAEDEGSRQYTFGSGILSDGTLTFKINVASNGVGQLVWTGYISQ